MRTKEQIQKSTSAGGKATAVLSRLAALKRYYLNPNVCLQCHNVIEVKEDEKLRAVKVRKFCNRSCSASYTNKSKPKIQGKSSAQYNLCECGITKRIHASKCRKCANAKTDFLVNRTKEDLFNKSQFYYRGRIRIGGHARKIYSRSGKPRKCISCGYDKHVDIAHIKAVAEFDNSSLISEINNIDNLVPLCPNCHWEYDHGLLQLNIICL